MLQAFRFDPSDSFIYAIDPDRPDSFATPPAHQS